MGFWKIFKELWGFTTNETHAGVDIPFSKSLVLNFPPYDTWWVSVIYPPGITREQKGGSKTLVWSLHWILHSIKPLALGYTRIEIMLGLHRPLLWWHPWPWALPHVLRTAYKGSIYPFLVKWFLKPPPRHFYFTLRSSHLIGPAPIIFGNMRALTQHRSPNMLPSPPK